MTFYNPFDCKIQCEENNQVSPEEYAEVMQMMADEHDAFVGSAEWADKEQRDFERQQEQAKDWTGTYSNNTEGDTYNGIAI